MSNLATSRRDFLFGAAAAGASCALPQVANALNCPVGSFEVPGFFGANPNCQEYSAPTQELMAALEALADGEPEPTILVNDENQPDFGDFPVAGLPPLVIETPKVRPTAAPAKRPSKKAEVEPKDKPPTPHVQKRKILAQGEGKLTLVNLRLGERYEGVFRVGRQYDPGELKAIRKIMRDWRNGKQHDIDPRTLDIMAAAHLLLETSEPYILISGYRSPETNAMLRKKSSAVAKNSLHMRGQAADLTLNSRSVAQLVRAGLKVARGGVGSYEKSHFCHMDCGPVRHWVS